MAKLDSLNLSSALAISGASSQADLRVAFKFIAWKLFHEYRDTRILKVTKWKIFTFELYVRDLESLLIAFCGPDPYRKVDEALQPAN